MPSPTERKPIGSSVALICGVGRNCGSALEGTLDAIGRATVGFRKTSFLVVESDSTDDTLVRLESLAKSAQMRAISLGSLRRHIPVWTERLAHCRNRIVEEVRLSGEFRDVDYVVVADLDGVNLKVQRKGIESAWSAPEPWDVVTANQDGAYYDVWALRHPAWCSNDCWQAHRELRPIFGDAAAYQAAIASKQMRLPVKSGLIEVESAFGGLAIYTKDAFVSGNYVGVSEDGEEVCEHVRFHADMRRKGYRIFINSALLNSPQKEHIGRASALCRFARSLFRR